MKKLLLLISFIILTLQVAAQTQQYNIDREFFIENKGQWNSEVLYLSKLNGMNAWITKSGVIYDFYKTTPNPSLLRRGNQDSCFLPLGKGEIKRGSFTSYHPVETERGSLSSPPTGEIERGFLKGHVIKSSYNGINPNTEHTGINKSEAYYNYFIGKDSSKWASFVPLYKEVLIKSVYNGIEIRYYFDNGKLRYDFNIQPNADISQIKMKLEGQEALFLNNDGDLVINTSLGEVIQGKLFAYQEICHSERSEESTRKQIQCRYIINPDGTICFELDNYNPDIALIIDPIVWSTYLGGSGEDFYWFTRSNSVDLDNSNNPYITGSSYSIDFPINSGAYQISLSGRTDCIISKFTSNGSSLIFSTFLGGRDYEHGHRIKISNNSIFIAGITASDNFPVTSGASQTFLSQGYDVFITKLNSSGSSLNFSTYLGGSGGDVGDYGLDMTVDNENNVYITGHTSSSNFPVTANTFQIYLNGSSDGFLTKLNSDGSSLIFSTYLGGSGDEHPHSVLINSSGLIILVGNTSSTNFPLTSDALQSNNRGRWNGFITIFNTNGRSLSYSTYLGSSQGVSKGDEFNSADINNDNIYITGCASSSDFPTTSGVFDETYNGNDDIVILKFNSNSHNIIYSTFIGDRYAQWGDIIKADRNGNVFILARGDDGETIPMSECAYKNHPDGSDLIIYFLNSTGSMLLNSTYFGGDGNDKGYGLAVSSDGCCIIQGFTDSNNFPVTNDAFDTTYNSNSDFFLTKFDFNSIQSQIQSINNLVFKTLTCSSSGEATFWIKNLGDCMLSIFDTAFSGTNSSEFILKEPKSLPYSVGGHDSIKVVVEFKPSSVGNKTADINIRNNSTNNPLTVHLSAKKDSVSFELSGLTGDTLDFGKGCQNSIINDTLFSIKNSSTIPTSFFINSLDSPFGLAINNPLKSQFGLNETRLLRLKLFSTSDTGLIIKRLIISDTCGNLKNIYLKLMLDPLPPAQISGSDTVCGKNNYTYTASPISGYTNKWNVTGGTTESYNESKINVTWDSAGNASITLIQTNNETNCTDSVRKIIFINPPPSMTLSGNLTACKNTEYSYSVNPEKNITNQWIIKGGIPESNSGDTINISWSDLDKGTIKLIRKNNITGCIDSTIYNVTLNALPFPIITGPLTVCGKGKYTYSSNSGGIINCDWHIEGGTPTTANGNKVEINWGEAGIGKITLIQTNTETGCKDSVTVEVTIGDKIKPTIAGRYTFCVGGETKLSADGDYDEYEWSTGETTKEITVSKAGKYALYVKDNSGCDGWSDSIEVREVQTPKPEIEAISSLCEGNPAILQTKEKYTSYQWSTGETTPEITVTNVGKITVSVIDSNGCSGSSDEFDLKFNPKPKANITGATTVCVGNTVSYNTEQQQDCEIKWTIDNGQSITADNIDKIDVNWTQLGSGKIKLVIINKKTNCSDSSEIEITIGNELKPVIVGAGTICSGTTITLSADADYDVYEWSTGKTTKTIEINKGGQYWLHVKNNGGCEGYSDTITIIQNPSPEPQITGTESLCHGEAGKLKVHKVIKWNTGEDTEEIIVTGPGTYNVEVTDENGCSGTATYIVKERKAEFSGIANVNLGNVSMGKSKQHTITIKNIGNETIKIKSIKLQTSLEYSLSTNPSQLIELFPSAEAELNITFLSNKTGNFIDNIMIETEQPCKDTYTINLTAECTGHAGKVTVWLPDTSAEAGRKGFCIPLRANYSGEESPLDIGYTAEVRFSSKAMDITSPNETIENGENVVNFSGNISLQKGVNKLGDFCGMVLLSDQSLNPLQISKFEWSEPLATDTVHGSLKILACQETLPAIKRFTPARIEITPNPSNESADITISGEGNTTLEIYSVHGKLVMKQELNLKPSEGWKPSEGYRLMLDLHDFGAGVYYAIVKSAIGTAGARMDIIK